jgi:hypothetical protein
VPESIRQTILAERAKKSSTGVKVSHELFFYAYFHCSHHCILFFQGVLADYKAAQALAQAQSQADHLYRQQVLTRMAEGAKAAPVIQQVYFAFISVGILLYILIMFNWDTLECNSRSCRDRE